MRRIEEAGPEQSLPAFGLWPSFSVSASFCDPLDEETQAAFDDRI